MQAPEFPVLLGWSRVHSRQRARAGVVDLDVLPDAQLERLAGNVKEYNLLVEGLAKQRNLFKNSLKGASRR